MAASPDFEENLLTNIDEKVLQCAICMERFKSPKILSCQHTFCEICLTKWVKTSNGQLICPTCKRTWTLPTGGVSAITNNRFMNDLMQVISDIGQQDRSKAKCDGCQKQATHWCGDCGGHFYCSVCIKTHRTVTILKAHKPLTVEDYNKMSMQQFRMVQPRFCDSHPDAKLEFYCDTCQVPTCNKCALVEHKLTHHEIMSLESALEKHLPTMKANTVKISEKIRDLKHRKQNVITTKKELVQNKEGAELQIKKLSEQAIAEIKKQEMKLLGDVANMYKPKCKQIDSKIELLEHKIASAESIHSYLNHLLNFGGSVDIMAAKKQQLHHEDLTNVKYDDIDSNLIFTENPDCLEIDLGAVKGNKCIQEDLSSMPMPVATKKKDLIKSKTVVDDVIQMEPGRVRFLFDMKKSELQMVRQQAKQQPFSIDKYQNNTGILVKGTADDVRAACEQLKKLAEKVSARQHPIDKLGMQALFKEDKVQMYLRVVENEFNCRIDVTDPSEVETAMGVEAEEEVPMMPPPTTLTVLCYVTRKDGRRIVVGKGDLTKMPLDAIVKGSNQFLDHSGGLTKAIIDAGGQSIADETTRILRAREGKLFPGQVVSTGSGDLPCKRIIHAVGPAWNRTSRKSYFKEKSYKEKMLHDTVYNSLLEAERCHCRSVALPAISSGAFGFPLEICVETIVSAVDEFYNSRPLGGLMEVNLVDNADRTCKSFQDSLVKHYGNEEVIIPDKFSGGNEIEDSPYKNLKQTRQGNQMTIGNIIVQVEGGDITKERTDAIVNSTNGSRLDLYSQGGVSKAILAAGGRDIVKECKRLGIQQPDTVVMTGAGNLQCNNIIHMITPYQKLDDSITRMLMFAESKQVKSLAMPAIGTGALGKDPSTVAEQTLKAIDDFYQQRNTQCLKLIRVVLFQRPMVQTFHQAMVSILGKPATDRRGYIQKACDLVGGLASSFVKASPGEPVRKWKTLLLYIFADKRKDIDGAVEKLESFMDTEFIDMIISKENVDKISDEELYQVKITAERLEVKLDKISTGSVTHLRLQGRVQTVFKVQEEITKILDRISEEERRKNEARLLAKNVKWMYLSDGEQFDEYDDEITGIIEQARVENRRDVEFEIEGGKYRIDFMTMKEIDLDDMSKVPVRRELREAGVPLPSNWVDMTQYGNFRTETLDSKTTEYQGVEQAFKQTLQPGYNLRQIVRIERLQNIQQYRQYVILKQTLDAKNPMGTKNERTLYYGTSADSVDKISEKGFNRSFARKNATLYGAGTYFAVNSEMSARSIYSSPDANGYKYIYQAKVLTGEFTVGSRNTLQMPPSKNPNDPTDCYDSVVDNMLNPEIFVIFNDALAYPEYLIVFY